MDNGDRLVNIVCAGEGVGGVASVLSVLVVGLYQVYSEGSHAVKRLDHAQKTCSKMCCR